MHEKNPRVKEGFPRQRLVVLSATAIERCKQLPMVKNLYVTHIGAFPSAPNHYVERKQGDQNAILIYCLKGHGKLKLGANTFEIGAGHCMIIPSDTPHIYAARNKASWSILWIHFNGELMNSMLQSLNTSIKAPVVYVPDVKIIESAFEDLYACLNYHYSDAGLFAMTSELMRLLSKIKLNQSYTVPQRQNLEERIIASMDFMKKHYDMQLTLGQLATRAGLSVTYYSKLFREKNDLSPMAWFTHIKVQKACDYLLQTNLTVQEISLKLGYEDPYYFSRLFKKAHGISPSNYRTKMNAF